MSDEQLKFPTGRFTPPEAYNAEAIIGWINDIKDLPFKLRETAAKLNNIHLDTPYRPGGWTARQVIHHLADSHTQALTRFKWALTENQPTIKAYKQDAWAELPDSKLEIEPSLKMIDGIHERMVALFETFTEADWNRTFIHPETGITYTLTRTVATYAWHGKHHLGHLKLVIGD